MSSTVALHSTASMTTTLTSSASSSLVNLGNGCTSTTTPTPSNPTSGACVLGNVLQPLSLLGEKLPAQFIERPKMPRATWDALRAHIVRQRKREKQEMEQSQLEEQQKREREHAKKEQALTLGDTKAEIANMEKRLAQLKEEKHQLFCTLKKVLNEDGKRRREVTQPPLYLQPTPRGVTGNPQHVKQHMLLAPTLKSINTQIQQQQQAVGLSRGNRLATPHTTFNSLYYRGAPGASVTASTLASGSKYYGSLTPSQASTMYASSAGQAYASYPALSREEWKRPRHIYVGPSSSSSSVHRPTLHATTVANLERKQSMAIARPPIHPQPRAPPAAHGGYMREVHEVYFPFHPHRNGGQTRDFLSTGSLK